jgi:hypothetical protein
MVRPATRWLYRLARRRRAGRRQHGAAAIEFVLLFPLLLLLCYVIVSYAWLFLAYQSLNSMSADALRAAVAVEYGSDGTPDDSAIVAEIEEVLGNLTIQAMGPGRWAALCEEPGIDSDNVLTLCLNITLFGGGEEAGNPTLPVLSLPGFGVSIPHTQEARLTSQIKLPTYL